MKEFMDLIDKQATLEIEQIIIPVIIRDVKKVFGRTDYLVEPVGGEGQQWVNSNRVHE